eukprot:gnl/MRDRNA2_/MRDRNA2_19426_c0_seq1.p1 gnl/MRDRNA2_/MRDRNA2_19426_c0~~gnl/MRDRNA2_/MRDRNA2_19426_c0_seq1.p1  ORF type:complete len:280 (-),score=50.50 gnl/MRDRNA2_/MRDRNA2_19426_c0_seq1:26-865(-)
MTDSQGQTPGETNLDKLVASMSPMLRPETYVWCAVPKEEDAVIKKLLMDDKLFSYFREDEALTVVVEKSVAEQEALKFEFPSKCLTLQVHSSLEAVGLTACFATELGRFEISANVVAGFHHDHIFVAEKDGEKAKKVLEDLSARKRAESFVAAPTTGCVPAVPMTSFVSALPTYTPRAHARYVPSGPFGDIDVASSPSTRIYASKPATYSGLAPATASTSFVSTATMRSAPTTASTSFVSGASLGSSYVAVAPTASIVSAPTLSIFGTIPATNLGRSGY